MSMQLSVIIVNYNVRYFLEPCLRSAINASEGMDVELIVVDNDSVDDSVSMVRELFPGVRLLVNSDNRGFSRANNQGIAVSRGKYVLLLNPDTLVEEDCFRKCYAFMESHPEAGALGIRMIDGSGRFLPESKRGFPSPFVAFAKATGLSTLFPRSRIFNRYHLGYLDEHSTHEVEVLSGAFMFIRRSVLEEIGYLDEQFFMYGEDIDLSYRVVQAGYKNYYYPEAGIVHYKGESTKKGSLNYVVTFYKAMIIFAKKHFTGRRRKNLVRFLELAVFARAGLTLVKNFIHRIWWVVMDFAFMYGIFVLTEQMWSRFYHGDVGYYPATNTIINYPLYSILFVMSAWFSGLYERRAQWPILLRSGLMGMLLSLVLYALVPTDYRSSRAIIVLGSALSVLYLFVSRLIVQRHQTGRWQLDQGGRPRLLIIGSRSEVARVESLLGQAGSVYELVATVAPSASAVEEGHMTHVGNLVDIARLNRVDELIFCARDIPIAAITHWMGVCGPGYAYKVIVEHGSGIVGSRSRHSSGQLYTLELQYRLADPVHRRQKRAFDVVASLLLLVFFPILCWWMRRPMRQILCIFMVLGGVKTWVGYGPGEPDLAGLPSIREGVFPVIAAEVSASWSGQEIHHQHFLYARDYRVGTDLGILLRSLFRGS